jgi:hypothetical protein
MTDYQILHKEAGDLFIEILLLVMLGLSLLGLLGSAYLKRRHFNRLKPLEAHRVRQKVSSPEVSRFL